MPSKTPDQLKSKAERLRKKLAEKKASLPADRVRKAKKKIRRAQRRRRVLISTAAKRAAPAKASSES